MLREVRLVIACLIVLSVPQILYNIFQESALAAEDHCLDRSHVHLRFSRWGTSAVINSLKATGTYLQFPDEDSSRPIKYDEYSVTIESMPPGVTPEMFLAEWERDFNKAIDSPLFTFISEFERRTTNTPVIGDIYDIDLPVDDGSVMLVEASPSHFILQTITTPFSETGSHPESGVRQFGFEKNLDGTVTFYTRSANQVHITPADGIDDTLDNPLGKYIQGIGWGDMIESIGERLGGPNFDQGLECGVP